MKDDNVLNVWFLNKPNTIGAGESVNVRHSTQCTGAITFVVMENLCTKEQSTGVMVQLHYSKLGVFVLLCFRYMCFIYRDWVVFQ